MKKILNLLLSGLSITSATVAVVSCSNKNDAGNKNPGSDQNTPWNGDKPSNGDGQNPGSGQVNPNPEDKPGDGNKPSNDGTQNPSNTPEKTEEELYKEKMKELASYSEEFANLALKLLEINNLNGIKLFNEYEAKVKNKILNGVTTSQEAESLINITKGLIEQAKNILANAGTETYLQKFQNTLELSKMILNKVNNPVLNFVQTEYDALNLLIQKVEKINPESVSQIELEGLTAQLESAINNLIMAVSPIEAKFEALNVSVNNIKKLIASIQNKEQAEAFSNELQNEVVNNISKAQNIDDLNALISKTAKISKAVMLEISKTDNTIKPKVLEEFQMMVKSINMTIEQISAFNPEKANEYKAIYDNLSKNINENSSLEQILDARDNIIEIMKEMEKIALTHMQVIKNIQKAIVSAQNGILSELTKPIYNALHSKLSLAIIDLTKNTNKPTAELEKLLADFQKTVAEVSEEKNKIDQEQEAQQVQQAVTEAKNNVNSLVSQLQNKIATINAYDAEFATQETAKLNEAIKGLEALNSVSEIQTVKTNVEAVLNEVNTYLNSRNKKIEELNNANLNINNEISKYNKPLYNTGENNILQQATVIKELLANFNNLSLAQLEALSQQYLEKFNALQQTLNKLKEDAQKIVDLGNNIKTTLLQKPEAELNEEQKAMLAYIETLPLGNYELIQGSQVSEILEKLTQFQAKLNTAA
ncbi:hypothetical protein [Mycoplasma sp. Z1473D]